MPLKLFRRGQVWHYRGTVAKRRLRGSTGSEDKATAQQIIADLEAQAWKCHIHGPASVLTFAQAAILYRQAGKPTRHLVPVEDYWKNTPVRQITAGAIRQSAIALLPWQSPATRNRQVIVPTQAIINHAAESELCAKISVKRFPVETKVKEPVTWEWVEAFMAHASPHLGALACFMFLTGARITEALEVRWGNVDLQARKALIKQTKVGNERRAHLPPPLVAALANIPSNREPGEKVFRYSRRDTAKPPWVNACKRAGIKPLTFHCCRHGFATALLHSGIDPVTVAKLGGWKTTQHVLTTYGHAMQDDTLSDRIGTSLTQRFSAMPKPGKISNG
jgi:integrase